MKTLLCFAFVLYAYWNGSGFGLTQQLVLYPYCHPVTEVNYKNVYPTSSKMKIKIGSNTFTATLYDNPTAAAFKSMLPLTVNMIELNGNEKYADVPTDLPTSASSLRTIQTGDLMIFGSKTLVLFYKTFSTSYSYTKLGKINDINGLAAAVGPGNVQVSFVLE
jgi:hypothetical protein